MKLVCVSSGSNANCYFLINSKGEILILDAGVKVDKLMNNKYFSSFKSVVGCLITHQHKDHSLAVQDFEMAGIEVLGYMNMQSQKKYQLGNYIIIPFNVVHDVKNYGYIIKEIDSKSLFVYATDFSDLPLIANINNWLIECNYCEDLWEEKLMGENPNYGYLGRVQESHMGLSALENYFSKIKTRPNKIILCHLSQNGNADKVKMIEAMSKYSQYVDIATKNKTWEID